MNNNTVLANSITHLPHLAAFDLIVKKRFDELQLDKLLVYLIDTVEASALPYLAAQFDVLGYKGYRLASNEAEQREIIKRAIELHRFKGTLWAVREAITSIGYADAEIIEHVENHWAKFRVIIKLGERSLNVMEIQDLIRMITEYKNERSHLADLSYILEFNNDTLSLIDESSEGPADDTIDGIFVGGNFKYDGVYSYNGERNFSQDSDTLDIKIL